MPSHSTSICLIFFVFNVTRFKVHQTGFDFLQDAKKKIGIHNEGVFFIRRLRGSFGAAAYVVGVITR